MRIDYNPVFDANKLSLNRLLKLNVCISTRHKLATIPDQPEISANGRNIKRVLKHTKA